MPPDLRFGRRVAAYVAGRPGYPADLPAVLRAHFGLSHDAVVADIGSGTGLLSRVFLADGHPVFGVEPDAAMAAAAVQALGPHAGFVDQRGASEDTGLPERSTDLLVAGQAFHWFDPPRARAEALRILRGRAAVAIIWNERPRLPTDPARSPFLAAYEDLILAHDLGTYRATSARWSKAEPLSVFFGGPPPAPVVLPHVHRVSLDGLVARAGSCSYLPGTDHPGYPDMVADLTRVFEQHQVGGVVDMAYRTQTFAGFLR